MKLSRRDQFALAIIKSPIARHLSIGDNYPEFVAQLTDAILKELDRTSLFNCQHPNMEECMLMGVVSKLCPDCGVKIVDKP